MSIKEVIEALETCLAMAEHGDFSTGYCCCGSSVEGHTMGDGHSPVDEGDYHAINAFDKARTALQALRAMPAEPVDRSEIFPLLNATALTEARPAQEAADAERYRWLRNNAEVSFDEQQHFPTSSGVWIYSTSPSRRELDAAIDAAIEAEVLRRGGGV